MRRLQELFLNKLETDSKKVELQWPEWGYQAPTSLKIDSSIFQEVSFYTDAKYDVKYHVKTPTLGPKLDLL